MKYIDIDEISGGIPKDAVKQNLKFKTGKFVWRVKFSADLDPSTINATNLYVTNSNGGPLKTIISYDAASRVIEIEPQEAYSKEEQYSLHITRNVRSKGGQFLPKEITVKFTL